MDDHETGIEIWIRSTDIDGDGIVNNSRFFQFFEQARLEHLSRLGVVVRPRPPGVADRAFTIAETTCRFLAPLRHRDRVLVSAWTSTVGRRSFGLAYRITASTTASRPRLAPPRRCGWTRTAAPRSYRRTCARRWRRR
ncbi:MAG: hypothetical protein CVU47_07125 [Chloroflexi bacterium HGW-Chloroflexi-9]|nr:MAG: hypothetical protein CVU47_07125 [Chloroflexi bacterium HGW-Chloroflexi-9]